MSGHDDLVPLVAEATTAGHDTPLDVLVPMLYDELRRAARRELQRERPGHTLSTTALVHEAYLELAKLRIEWRSRAHFFGVCARVIRHVLVDYAVERNALKRGAGARPISLDRTGAPDVLGSQRPDAWLDLDEALQRLAAADARQARVVECRFFAGMSIEETAEALGVAAATVKRDWALARAWLNRELSR